MRLMLFRSLVHDTRRSNQFTANVEKLILHHIQNHQQEVLLACSNASRHDNNQKNQTRFQGIELCSTQITERVLDTICSATNSSGFDDNDKNQNPNIHLLCRIIPTSTDDACHKLDQLSQTLSSNSSSWSSSNYDEIIKLVIIDQPPPPQDTATTAATTTLDATLNYLTQILPVGAQFLESHPTIGNSKNERNAHGNPLDTHVLGVCHSLQHFAPPPLVDSSSSSLSMSEKFQYHLSEIVDVLPPTRLSWKISNNHQHYNNSNTTSTLNAHRPLFDIEQIIQSVDHIDFDLAVPRTNTDDGSLSLVDESLPSSFHHQVWNWQHTMEMKETYVSCSNSETAKMLQTLFYNKYKSTT